MSGDMVFVDEAHFGRPDCILNGPLAQMGQNACIVFASTPATGTSGIEGVLKGVDDYGNEICTKVDFEFTCPACKKKQEKNPEVLCVHRMHLRPHIQDSYTLMIAKAAYGENVDAFRREMMGSTVIDAHAFISPRRVEVMRTMEPYATTTQPRFLFVSTDPSGASKKDKDGTTSAYAIVTAFVEESKIVVKNTCVFIYIIRRRRLRIR